jgi:hypothetical protein
MANRPTESWWAPWQLNLVEDRSRTWQRTRFEPSGSVEFVVDGKRVTRKAQPGETPTRVDEWDHEHCVLCYAKISLQPPDDPVGFRNGDDWMCSECYSKFIEPRLTEHE